MSAGIIFTGIYSTGITVITGFTVNTFAVCKRTKARVTTTRSYTGFGGIDTCARGITSGDFTFISR
jgi:hypothetical protein